MPRYEYACHVSRSHYRVVVRFARKRKGADFGTGVHSIFEVVDLAVSDIPPTEGGRAAPSQCEALAESLLSRLVAREATSDSGKTVSVEVIDSRYGNGVTVYADVVPI